MARVFRQHAVGLLLALSPCAGLCQTTQGVVSGVVRKAGSGEGITGATVFYCQLDGEGKVKARGAARTDEGGFYVLAPMAPGEYRLRAQEGGGRAGTGNGDCFPAPPDRPVLQAQEKHDLFLGVAARMEVDFALRAAVPETAADQGVYVTREGMVVRYFGADQRNMRSIGIDTGLAGRQWAGATVSYVVDPRLVEQLPFAGRDVYSVVALLPGVTSDSGTSRGLGVSIHGQRPSASNYLLDGVESNNQLVSGPLAALAPEMIQEYRVSTGSWSAEYGRTAGFLANAMVRAGGQSWNGTAFANLKDTVLNANSFQNNARKTKPESAANGRYERAPFREWQAGLQAGGPAVADRVWLTGSFAHYRSRGLGESVPIFLPSASLARSASGEMTRRLLTAYPPPAGAGGNGFVTATEVRPTVSLDRSFGFAGVDVVAGRRRMTARSIHNRTERPDFIWTPYKDFVSGMTQPMDGLVMSLEDAVRPNLVHELRAGLSRNRTRWDRAHPEVPTLVVGTAVFGVTAEEYLRAPTVAPGSPAFYSLNAGNRSWEVNDSVLWSHRAHILKAGAGVLARGIDIEMAPGQDGQFTFADILAFSRGEPSRYRVALARQTLPSYRTPEFARTYRQVQMHVFADDNWRVSRQLTVSAGLRFETARAPVRTGGGAEAEVQLGAGRSMAERLGTATLGYPAGGRLWNGLNGVWMPRVGFSWDGGRWRLPVLRGGYGLFADRPFDNQWATLSGNAAVIPAGIDCFVRDAFGRERENLCVPGRIGDAAGYLAGPGRVMAALAGQRVSTDFPKLTLVDPGLRPAVTQSYFLGLEQSIGGAWFVQVNGIGAMGQRLLTTDVVNRAFTVAPDGRLNERLPDVLWRAGEGASQYAALTAMTAYRRRRVSAQVSYTWGHSIDNQSDALSGHFFDLGISNFSRTAKPAAVAAFSRQFDFRADRGSSDFDQRHNVTFYSVWNLPALGDGGMWRRVTEGWSVAQMAAARTGFPFSVYAPSAGAIFNQRADVVGGGGRALGGEVEAGAVRLLDAAGFSQPAAGRLGNSGRNAFQGPGLWNLDVSVSRGFAARGLGERGRVTVRADFFNALNHANLNAPDGLLGSATFGQAKYGRAGFDPGFPALVPFSETARQVQLILRVGF